MRTATKITKTFSLDKEVLAKIRRSKGALSESARVNHLLHVALEMERRAALEHEAASFFESMPEGPEEREAFRKASLKSWARD